ncbi:hypothetical protein NUU61_005473 [Penicillium alfredii]|uniref:NADAR domain-containing protein n=1 Tax=Penicillium alfredii TaxID=1506179 RepID=A0A9W9F9I1_9EURO|nr:uncharacterized protein NUU61_005473 [Penicillium alfredii]KAJ5096117.1 hypothetical protein NUU61_005473 [Penicillium alfredii]
MNLFEIDGEASKNAVAPMTKSLAEKCIFFWKPAGNFGEFSQWFRSTFIYDGLKFVTAEQFMMYKKAKLFGNEGIAQEILKSPNLNPARHKKMGRSVKNFNDKVWQRISFSIVVDGNFHKFVQNPELARVLLSTVGYRLAEASGFDKIWGIGFSAAQATANWQHWGQNKLGHCLMVVRDMLVDLQCRLPSSFQPGVKMQSKIAVEATTVILCCICAQTTVVEPKERKIKDNSLALMLTTCQKCVETNGLACGWRTHSQAQAMIERTHEDAGVHSRARDLIEPRDGDRHIMTHPSVAGMNNMEGCMTTTTNGYELGIEDMWPSEQLVFP